MITTVLAFLATLALLIVVHEWGHYRVAVACGVKVLRFSVGFGRVLLRWQRGPDATEFVVCALPLGGYVKMLDEREAPVAADQLARTFNRQPLSRRAAIVAAGPLANLLLAVLLYAAAGWIGIEEPLPVLSTPAAGSAAEQAGLRGGDRVLAVSRDGSTWTDVASMSDLRWALTEAALQRQTVELQVAERPGRSPRTLRLDLSRLQAEDIDARLMQAIGLGPAFREAVVADVRAGSPAAAAGLRAGDRVLAVDGTAIADASALIDRVRRSAERASPGSDRAATLAWRVERDGQMLDLAVTPRLVRDERSGAAVGRVDAAIGGMPAMATVRHGPLDGLLRGAERTWEVSALTLKMLGRMLVGEASLKNLSGPLTIADFAGQSVQKGPADYLAFLAVVSISLGVLNLLPLPLLDGGHLMYYIFEAVTGRPVSDLWLARLQRGGIALLLTMMSVALFNDVARLLGLH